MSSSIQGHPSLWRGSVTPLDHSVMDEARVPTLFSIIARGDLFASISAMRCAEADAVDRAQRYLRGEGVGPLWRRLSDAIGRRARRTRLYWVMRVHRGLSTMPGLGRTRAQRRADRADADIGRGVN